MRKILLSAALSMVAVSPGAARATNATNAKSTKHGAKAAAAPAEGEEAPAPEGSAKLSGGAPAPAGGDAPSSAHTVEKGDTLWDLSQKYLGSPWYWPKVWSYNPEIANPNWIYPGNTVRFFQAGDEAPTQVEVGSGPTEAPDVEEGAFVPDDEDRVSVSGQIGYVPKRSISLQATGFVTAAEVEETGSIVGSFGESDMLSFPQTAYVEFKDSRAAKLGETFVVFRSGGQIDHPITKEVVGYLTRIVGAVRVVRLDKNGMATVTIEKQFDEIRRGDLLGPMGESLIHSVSSRPNDREVKGGVVVSSTTTFLTKFAEHHIVIIDRGADDGVKPGNTFVVTRQHDSSGHEVMMNPTVIQDRFPREDVARCMAFEVKAKATTCLVIYSIRELVKGDLVELRPSTTRSAMR